MSGLRSAIEGYIEALAAGGYDMPRRAIVDDLRALLAASPDTESTGLPGGTEYAILSFRDGLEPVDSLEEAEDQMRIFWQKPGRARIVHRSFFTTEWAPLNPAAEGPALEAA